MFQPWVERARGLQPIKVIHSRVSQSDRAIHHATGNAARTF